MPVVAFHKQKKNGVSMSQIMRVDVVEKPEHEQLSLFQKEIWESEMMQVIKKFQTFYPSEIRLLCRYMAPFDNDAGPFYRKLMRQNKIKRTGQYRPSICSSRRGGVEWEYLNQM
jgi:hypothetical protein